MSRWFPTLPPRKLPLLLILSDPCIRNCWLACPTNPHRRRSRVFGSRSVERSVLGQTFINDMLHIALATISEVDVLVSWNFKHIVRLDKIRLFNAVNIEQGYKPLTIYSPREVISDATESRVSFG